MVYMLKPQSIFEGRQGRDHVKTSALVDFQCLLSLLKYITQDRLVAPPTVGCTLLHHLISIPTGLPTHNLMPAILQLKISLSKCYLSLWQVDKKKKSNQHASKEEHVRVGLQARGFMARASSENRRQ